jgi:pimeloyl-ACP methyl ester carboxylesterase
MAKVEVNGINMHYQRQGEGPDVVLVHGLTSTLAFWYATKVFPLLKRGFCVTAFDLRGHGYSDATPTGYTSKRLAEDVRGLLDAIGIERARVIGHSYGGSVALHFAMLFPERTEGAVICDTGFASLRHLRVIDDWPGWEKYKDDLPKVGITPDWFAEADQHGIDVVLRKSLEVPMQMGLRQGGSRDNPRFRRLLDETTVGTDFRDPAGLTEDCLAEITPPILAMYGHESPFRNVAGYLQQKLPCCAGEVVTGAGHFFLMHEPEAFVDAVTPFLLDPRGYVEGKKSSTADAQPETGGTQ